MAWLGGEIEQMKPEELQRFCFTEDRDVIIENIGAITTRLSQLIPVDVDFVNQRIQDMSEQLATLLGNDMQDPTSPWKTSVANRLQIIDRIVGDKFRVATQHFIVKGGTESGNSILMEATEEVELIGKMIKRLEMQKRVAITYRDDLDPNKDDLPF